MFADQNENVVSFTILEKSTEIFGHWYSWDSLTCFLWYLLACLGMPNIENFKFQIDWTLTFMCRQARSQSCPFCRDSLKRVNSCDLWIYTSRAEIVDLTAISRENLKRLIMYIEKLPLIVPDPAFVSYDPLRWEASFFNTTNSSSMICVPSLEWSLLVKCYY